MDLIKNKYHIFNPKNAKKKGYYPRELLQMIEELPNFEKESNVEVGKIYTVRAFFAISTGCYRMKLSIKIHYYVNIKLQKSFQFFLFIAA